MMKSMLTGAALSLALAGTALAVPGGAGQRGHGPAARLTQLKAQLAIKSSQQEAWERFTSALKAMHPKRMRPAPSKMAGLVPAPKVFDQLADHAAERAQSAKQLASAVDALYKALSPVQRAVLDTHLAEMRARHMHGRHHWRGRREGERGRMGRRMPPPPQ